MLTRIIVGLAALILRPGLLRLPPTSGPEYIFHLRLEPSAATGLPCKELMTQYLTSFLLVRTELARQGTAMDLTYHVRLKDEEAAIAFVTDLKNIACVQGVDLRKQ